MAFEFLVDFYNGMAIGFIIGALATSAWHYWRTVKRLEKQHGRAY